MKVLVAPHQCSHLVLPTLNLFPPILVTLGDMLYYHFIVLICIFLMNNNAEHLSMWDWSFGYLLKIWELPGFFFTHFSIDFSVFLLVIYKSSLYFLNTTSLLDICIVTIFSFVFWLFIPLIVSFNDPRSCFYFKNKF